jgi:hypothetical protein
MAPRVVHLDIGLAAEVGAGGRTNTLNCLGMIEGGYHLIGGERRSWSFTP